MQADLIGLLLTNLVFSLRVAPVVVLVATLIRAAILVTGRRRTFVTWTRNSLLSAITIIFAPGMLIDTGVRYAICSLFGIDIEGVGGGSTYAEINLFLKVDRPPRVSTLLFALFVSAFLSVFIGFALLFLPVALLLGVPVVLLSWYLAVAVLFNTCIRGGDVSLLSAAIRSSPRRGLAEFTLFMCALLVFYIQLVEVVVI